MSVQAGGNSSKPTISLLVEDSGETTTALRGETTPFWSELKQRELELAKKSSYNPGKQPTANQLVLAAKELEKRINEGLNKKPWVLVATNCDGFPRDKLRTAEEAAGGLLKMFLAHDGSLFLIAVCDKNGLHATCVSIVTGAMYLRLRHTFEAVLQALQLPGTGPGRSHRTRRCFTMHFPRRLTKVSPLRAPLVAEIHSGLKTVASSLSYLSTHFDHQFTDYVLYMHAYPKRSDGTNAAVACLWWAGTGN